jgi:hypothetical protein
MIPGFRSIRSQRSQKHPYPFLSFSLFSFLIQNKKSIDLIDLCDLALVPPRLNAVAREIASTFATSFGSFWKMKGEIIIVLNHAKYSFGLIQG